MHDRQHEVPAGPTTRAASADRGGHVVDVLQRHERDREIRARRRRAAAAPCRRSRPCRRDSCALARASAAEPSTSTTTWPRARRSRATRPSPEPRSRVSRPGRGTSSKKRAPWNCSYESCPGVRAQLRPVGRLLVPRLAASTRDRFCHPRAAAVGLCADPAGERHVVDLVEHDAHRFADRDRRGIDLVDLAVGARHEVADEADRRILVELDDDRVVRRDLGERGQQRRVRDDERPDRGRGPTSAPSAPRSTGSAGTSAGAACAARRTTRTSARAARRARSPPRTARVVGSSRSGSSQPVSIITVPREEDRRGRHAFAARHERHVGALDLRRCDVPRIWRTPSRTRLKPCTYASDMPPPDVFTGSRPFGHSMLPSSVNGPPSPRSQKP